MDELMEKVFSKYPELRNISNLLISVNNEYYSGIPLRENDRVAFFPQQTGFKFSVCRNSESCTVSAEINVTHGFYKFYFDFPVQEIQRFSGFN